MAHDDMPGPEARAENDGVFELALGALLFLLTLTLDTGRMPVLGILAVPVVAAVLLWTVVRPRQGPAGFRQRLAALKTGPLGLLAGFVVLGAVAIGAMARDGREAFEPARSAAPGMAAAAILALAVLSALLAGRLRSSRLVVWAGLALVGLLLEPIFGPTARIWALRILSGVVTVSGAWQLGRFVRTHPLSSEAIPPADG